MRVRAVPVLSKWGGAGAAETSGGYITKVAAGRSVYLEQGGKVARVEVVMSALLVNKGAHPSQISLPQIPFIW